MLRINLKILMVGYSEAEASLLYADLSKINIRLHYKAITDVKDIRAVFYENDWQVLICNHTEHSFNFMDALEIWKQIGRNVPFIIYSDEMNEVKAISAIHHGVHDYIYKGQVARLVLAIERELKDVETRRAKLQAESKVYRLAYYDDLTGFPKRNLFCEKITSILSKESNTDKLAAVYFIKIGRLPYINSTYGYNVGDMLIQQLSYRMSVYANSKCLLSRIESSKFAFFNCEVSSLADIQKFADRIMKMVSTPIMINGFEFCATINIGVSVYPAHGSNISMLLAIAEKTLSESQDNLRNSCRYFMNKVGETATRQLKLGEILRKAFLNNEFAVYYEPIVDLKTGNIKGTEAILRCNHPEIDLLSTSKFIALAYETGLILEIGKWMLKQACLQTKLWNEMGHGALSVTIGISSIELDQNQFVKYVKDVLVETGFAPNLLELKFTESFLQDAEISMNNLQELGGMGIKLSIDCYGTGGSAIGSLIKLPINSLKIDNALTSDLGIDSDNTAIVTAINALARSLGISVIAEGVATKEQFEYLCEIQCDYAQGNLFGEPIIAEDFLALLERRKTGTLS